MDMRFQIKKGVIPADDCMDAGGRATQEAKAEAGIQQVTD